MAIYGRRGDVAKAAEEQGKNEPDDAYAAFTLYRQLGGDRSQAAVAAQLDVSESQVSEWSTEHGWVARAKAWDAMEAERVELEAEASQRPKPDTCPTCDQHVFTTHEGYWIDQALVPDGPWVLYTTPEGTSVAPRPSNMQAGYHMHKHQPEGVHPPSLDNPAQASAALEPES
jgi:hypothetical protein